MDDYESESANAANTPSTYLYGSHIDNGTSNDSSVSLNNADASAVASTNASSDDQAGGAVDETADAGLETELVEGEEDQEEGEGGETDDGEEEEDGGYAGEEEEGDEEEDGAAYAGDDEESEDEYEEDGAAYAGEDEEETTEEDGLAYAGEDEDETEEDVSVVGGEDIADDQLGGDASDSGTEDSALVSGGEAAEAEDDTEAGGDASDSGEADDALTPEEQLAGGYEDSEDAPEDIDAITSTQAGGYVEGADEYDSMPDVPVDAPIYSDGLQ